MEVLAVAIGGAIGAVARFWMSNGVYAWLGRDFPWGTLVVNVVGSLVMGWLYVHFVERGEVSQEVRLALMTGLLGGLTTFSTFSLETVQLLERGHVISALGNVVASAVVCVAVCWLAIWVTRNLL